MVDMPTIYILHGWAIGLKKNEKWQPFIKLLKQDGFSVKFLEIPGFSTPPKEEWQLKDFIEWLKKQVEKENKIILMGHSFGGHISIRFTAQNPEIVDKLILISTAGIRDKSPVKILKRGFFWLIAKVGKSFKENEKLRNIFYSLIGTRDYLNASLILRKTMKNVLKDEIRDDLSKIKVPTLIIWGKNDKITPVKYAYLIHRRVKNSKLEIIEDARHSSQFTHPEIVAKLVRGFIK
jgi:pimeloyl-ACP methyl ester carboxylesterase